EDQPRDRGDPGHQPAYRQTPRREGPAQAGCSHPRRRHRPANRYKDLSLVLRYLSTFASGTQPPAKGRPTVKSAHTDVVTKLPATLAVLFSLATGASACKGVTEAHAAP